MRVHELAKELDVSSAELLDAAEDLGLDVTHYAANLTDEEESALRGAPARKPDVSANASGGDAESGPVEESYSGDASPPGAGAVEEQVAAPDATPVPRRGSDPTAGPAGYVLRRRPSIGTAGFVVRRGEAIPAADWRTLSDRHRASFDPVQ